jgi:ethanolamine utilization protein EutN
MTFGRVLGSVTATIKHPTFTGERLLAVQPTTADGKPDGDPFIAIDRLGARRGDRILCTNDGMYVQELLGSTCPGYWSVAAFPES